MALFLLVEPEGGPTELGRQIASRYTEILVDEYQDTNEVQNAIFQAVSREGQNLFMVGDVKQSIYASVWRGRTFYGKICGVYHGGVP